MIVESLSANALRIELGSEAETQRLGEALASLVEPGVVLALVGTLGAGKTRLTRALAEAMGVDPRAISSPTFVLVNEYLGALPIYHFDAYRLENPDAFDALGASDYWTEGGGVCVVEWADLVADRLPRETWWLTITVLESGRRQVEVVSPCAEPLKTLLLTEPA